LTGEINIMGLSSKSGKSLIINGTILIAFSHRKVDISNNISAYSLGKDFNVG
jgi:hypothetical protein